MQMVHVGRKIHILYENFCKESWLNGGEVFIAENKGIHGTTYENRCSMQS